jgi:hypothetical protein
MKTTGIIFILMWLTFGDIAWGETVSGIRLLKNAENFDMKVVRYQGEMVGDIMRRGEYAWVNLSDGSGVISVWCRFELADAIKFKGDYHTRGDTLLVEGPFRRFCLEHGGDTDLHAADVQVVKPGDVIHHPFKRKELTGGLMLISIGVILAGIYKFVV